MLLFSNDGTDLFGRSYSLDFAPMGDDLKKRFAIALGDQDLTLTPRVDNGDLVFDCNTALPPMLYQVQLRIAGLKVRGPVLFEVPFDPKTAAPIPISISMKRVRLIADPLAFDPQIRNLVASPKSVIDGMPAADWLQRDNVDAQRKACVLNLLAKLRCVPSPDNPVIAQIDHIVALQLERMYVRIAPALADDSSLLLQGDVFDDRQAPTSPTHQLLVKWIKTKLPPLPETATYVLRSFRQAITHDSMQIVVAKPSDQPDAGRYADIDIDLGNPLVDVVGFLTHIKELIENDGEVTDHFTVHKDFVKDATLRQFLYYEVENG